MNNTLVIYIHGKGGNADESEHYKKLFAGCDIAGFDYKSETPWDFKDEFLNWAEEKFYNYKNVILVANSIGAYFSMNAISRINEEIDEKGNRQNKITAKISKAFFISPIVNMEKLIGNMMTWANVTENQLKQKKIVNTDFGENLSWEYLTYVRKNPIEWEIPTEILYGEHDNLTSLETVSEFARAHNANLTVMNGGEHWFHTDEQMKFLDGWIEKRLKESK
ncbi:MAG: alpha/beta hydrolase [Treponema sp.]|nr:alpha/beta hydrolase [Treponema sp.]